MNYAEKASIILNSYQNLADDRYQSDTLAAPMRTQALIAIDAMTYLLSEIGYVVTNDKGYWFVEERDR